MLPILTFYETWVESSIKKLGDWVKIFSKFLTNLHLYDKLWNKCVIDICSKDEFIRYKFKKNSNTDVTYSSSCTNETLQVLFQSDIFSRVEKGKFTK